MKFEELESARATREVLSAPSADRGSGTAHGNTQVWRFMYLELRLASPAPPEVEHALGAEFFRQAAGRPPVRVWWKARPVHFYDPRTIRLRWEGIAPSIEAALAELSRHVEVAACQTVKMPNWDVAQGPQLDELIRRLILAEVMLGAKYLTQRRLGLNANEAAVYVDQLSAEVV